MGVEAAEAMDYNHPVLVAQHVSKLKAGERGRG